MSKSPSLRRIQADIRELARNPSDRYKAAPLESDMFEWHFTIRGPEDTEFAGGIYHGRILLPPDYPFKPPHIIFLTKNGRFEINTKVCLSFSAFHPELWQPAWGIRLILEALIAFLPTPADGAIGALDYTHDERKRLAKLSGDYYCPLCQATCNEMLPKSEFQETASTTSSFFQKEIQQLRQMQEQQHAKEDEEDERKPAAENQQEEADPVDQDQIETKDVLPTDEVRLETPEMQPEPTPLPTAVNPPNESTGIHRPPVTTEDDTMVEPLLANNNNRAETSLESGLLDPFLQLCIILLAILIYLLARKIQALLDELDSLS